MADTEPEGTSDPPAPPVEGPFASEAEALFNKGWEPLPMLVDHKKNPPKGTTGRDGVPMSKELIRTHVQRHGDRNVAVRMPVGLIAIDVDHYGDKKGHDTITALEERLGPLPTAPCVTARPWPSGKFQFMVPEGMDFATTAGPGTEIIQRSHRYMVVPPSIHAEAGEVKLVMPDGEVLDELPEIGQFEMVVPFLPKRWVEYLRTTKSQGPGEGSLTAAEAATARWTSEREPVWLDGLRARLRSTQESGACRHDTLIELSCWAARESQHGLYRWTDVVEMLSTWWSGETFDRETRHEFRQGLLWGAAVALREPETDRLNRAVMAFHNVTEVPLSELTDGLTGGDTPDTDAIDERLDGWTPIEITSVHDLPPDPEPMLVAPEGGVGLFYPDSINGMFGGPGSGKSWVAALAARDEIMRGGTVLWVDLEQTAAQTYRRMLLIGTPPELLYRHLLRVRPTNDVVAAIKHVRLLCGLRGVTLVVLDSLGEAFAIDGVNENNDNEVGPWQSAFLRALADDHLMVITIDHSVKAEGGPLFPSGSKRKKAAITGALYEVSSTGFSKSEPGVIFIKVAKDRYGNRPGGQNALNIFVEPDGEDRLGMTVRVPLPADDAVEPMPRAKVRAVVMAIAAVMEDLGVDVMSKREIREHLSGRNGDNDAYIDTACRHEFMSLSVVGQKHEYRVEIIPSQDWEIGVEKSPMELRKDGF